MKNKYILFFTLCFLATACASKKYDTVNTPEEANKINNNVKNEQIVDNTLKINDKVFFNFDSSDLSTESKTTLNLLVKYLEKNPKINILIEGHTDERGTREYNIALGQRRAASVKKYLIAKGISADKVKIISFGKEKPEFVGDNEKAWSKNRRAVSVIIESKKNK